MRLASRFPHGIAADECTVDSKAGDVPGTIRGHIPITSDFDGVFVRQNRIEKRLFWQARWECSHAALPDQLQLSRSNWPPKGKCLASCAHRERSNHNTWKINLFDFRFKNIAKRLFRLIDSLKGISARENGCEAAFAEVKKPNRINTSSIAIDKSARRNKSRRRFAHQGRQREAISLMEWSAVPACDFANRMWAVRKLARPATTPVYQELVARGADRLSATMKRGTGLS
jgi:hypothetical protein